MSPLYNPIANKQEKIHYLALLIEAFPSWRWQIWTYLFDPEYMILFVFSVSLVL